MTAPPAPRLQGAWASYDANGDGALQPAELAKLVAAVRGSFTPMRLDAAHAAMAAAGLDVDEQWLRGVWCVARCSIIMQTVGCGGQTIDGRWEMLSVLSHGFDAMSVH